MKSKIITAAALAAAVASVGSDRLILPDRGDGNTPGEVYAANEARFTEANFSEPLTTYAIGWKDPNNIEEMLEFVAPAVTVPRRFEFAKFSNSEEFLSESDDIRAIGGDFKRIEYTSQKVNEKTYNKGMTIRVDLDNVKDLPNWRELYTGRIMRRLFRNELRRAVTALAAAATNTGFTWDTTAGKDPDQDVATKIIAYQDAAGVNPSRVLYGTVAWNKRRISHRAQNTAGGFASASMNESEVAGYLGVDAVKVSKERYQSAAATKTKVTPDIVLIYLAESGVTTEDPANIKRFTSPCDGGQAVRVYEQQINSKLVDITVEHYSNIVVVGTLGLQKLTIS